MPVKKKQSKLKRFGRALVPNTKLKQLLAFILVFGAVGGGYFLYRSFAYSPWEYTLRAYNCPNINGVPGLYTQGHGPDGCMVTLHVVLWERAGLGTSNEVGFGPYTRAAVVQWQKANNITPDGAVGPQTWYTLQVALNAQSVGSSAPAGNYSYLSTFGNGVVEWGCQTYTTAYGGTYNVNLRFMKPQGATLGPPLFVKIYRKSIGGGGSEIYNSGWFNTYFGGTTAAWSGSLNMPNGDSIFPDSANASGGHTIEYWNVSNLAQCR